MLSASSAMRTTIGVTSASSQPAAAAVQAVPRTRRLPTSAVATAMLWPDVHNARSGSTEAAMPNSAMLRARGRPGS